MEALLGVFLASNDPRATSLIAAISADSVARDILARVDFSPVGTQPQQAREVYNPRGGTSSVGRRIASELADSTREWQRHVLQTISKNTNPATLGSASEGENTALPFFQPKPNSLIGAGRLTSAYVSISPRRFEPP